MARNAMTNPQDAVTRQHAPDLLYSSEGVIFDDVVLDSGCVDAQNSPTTYLRAGLVLGKLTATGLFTDYDYDALDGSEDEAEVVILAHDVEMDGVNDKQVTVYRAGQFKFDSLHFATAADKSNFEKTKVQRLQFPA